MLCHGDGHPVSCQVYLVFHDHVSPQRAGQCHLVHRFQLDRMHWLLVLFAVVAVVSISSFP